MRLCALVLLLVSLELQASDLFANEKVLSVTLTGPLSTLARDLQHTDELPFTLDMAGNSQSIQVRARGNSRRKLCRHPPLRLRLGEDKLKLVRPCTDGAAAEADVLEEYAAYRLFNLLSDISLRVRLLQVTYVDTARNAHTPYTRYSFLIEPEQRLAERTGGVALRSSGVTLGSLDPTQAARVFVFQYLIGNSDWSLATPRSRDYCCHNVRLLFLNDAVTPVPYDFDLTALVNPRYAKTEPALRGRRVTRRRYRGYCIDEGPVTAAIEHTRSMRQDLLATLQQVPGLPAAQQQRARKLLEKFFAEAARPQRLLKRFRSQCLGS